DLESYHPEWTEPITTNYRGYDVYEMPPNGHGISVLMALNMLSRFEFAERECPETYHTQIEALKLAFMDAKKYVTDPRYMSVTVKDLLSKAYAEERSRLISHNALMPEAGTPGKGSTVFLCTADGEGNMVSYIQSNFLGFGSGVVVPG